MHSSQSRNIGSAFHKDISEIISSSSFHINTTIKMICEHPTCILEANTICKYHCHLSVCQQHRIEHEKTLLSEFEKQLDDLANPISSLLNQYRSNLKDSEESRKRELDRVNSLFDSHLTVLDQRLKLSKTTNELISNKREQLIRYENGDHQLTKEDYQQLQNLSKQIQIHLQQQYQFNNQIRDKNNPIHSWTIENKDINNQSTGIECIEISDSDDERPEDETDDVDTEYESLSFKNKRRKVSKKRGVAPVLLRHLCPLTKLGVFGLKSSHNLSRFCSKSNNRPRYLYHHLTRFHSIKSSLANKIAKAIRDGQDPMKTTIFPQDNTKITLENISCPFDLTASRFNQKNSIPNTPCTSSLNYHYFKDHLRSVHSITRSNALLICKAMRDLGTISHVQFEEDLCEMD